MISQNTFGHIYFSLDQAKKHLRPIVMKVHCCRNDPVTWIGSSEIFCINSSYTCMYGIHLNRTTLIRHQLYNSSRLCSEQYGYSTGANVQMILCKLFTWFDIVSTVSYLSPIRLQCCIFLRHTGLLVDSV